MSQLNKLGHFYLVAVWSIVHGRPGLPQYPDPVAVVRIKVSARRYCTDLTVDYGPWTIDPPVDECPQELGFVTAHAMA